MLDPDRVSAIVVGVRRATAERVGPGQQPVVPVEAAEGDTAQRIDLRDGLEPVVELVDLGRAEGVRVSGDAVARLRMDVVGERGRQIAVRADRADHAAGIVVHIAERGVVTVGPRGD
ncbi:hypothetical protein, partial [Streptomyces mediolani]|uniref:hypothetical protein n=1 Tax=Streptomyces mediolani TaxID=68237 RepID=UPI001F1E4B1B